MGRIKTQFIKRLTNKIIEAHGDEMTTDFENNKKLVSKFTDVSSPKIRNTIAGYAARLKKAQQKREF